MLNEKIIGDYAFQQLESQKAGTGQFSHVYRGYHLKTHEQVAIKQIDKKLIKGIFEQMVRNEINILKQINHRYILKLLNFYETINNIYIITEYCETDILSILKQQQRIPEEQSILYITQLADALNYLGEQNIIHRDIKPANILLHNGEVRLADFGFAINSQSIQNEERQFQIGSPLYMSPETLMLNQYNHKTDIWSLGILFYEMIFGVVPFFSMEMQNLLTQLNQYKQDYTLQFKFKISNKSTEAIQNLLAYDPKHRCNLIQLIQILQGKNQLIKNKSQHKNQQQQDQSPIAKKAIINNNKELVKLSGLSSDKKILFQNKKENNTNNNQLNEEKQDVSVIRQLTNEQNLKELSNEDFLTYYLEKLQQLKSQDESNNQTIILLSYQLYDYYGKNEQVLNSLKLQVLNN